MCEGGNFLALVAMQAQFDPLLQQLVRIPAKSTKFLSPQILNELIQLLANGVHQRLVSQMQNSSFYAIIFDTTSDIARQDQASLFVRWLNIDANKKFLCRKHLWDSLLYAMQQPLGY